jgi:hypothetical protein
MPALLLLVLLVLAFNKASAQPSTSSSDKSTFTDKVTAIQRGDRSFTIKPSYVLTEMMAGRRDVKLTISISAPSSGSEFLELRGAPVVTSQDVVDKLQFTANGSEDSEDSEEVIHTRKYHFSVRLDDTIDPRPHQVKVAFGLKGEPERNESLRYFVLNVGVNKNGKLAPIPPAEDSQIPSFETGFFGGAKHTYQLNLQNSFSEYTVSIESIRIYSEPLGLIEEKTFPFENGINMLPGEQKTIPLEFETTALGLKNLIRGLAITPRIKAEVLYNDGKGRRITDFKPRFAVNIPPTSQALIGAVFLGLLLGAGIRTLLEWLVFKKQLNTPSVLKLISYSLLFGLLLVVLVVVGQIEIKAKTFSMSSSYDNPLVMFSVGLIGAIAGLQMIIGWYKSFKVD